MKLPWKLLSLVGTVTVAFAACSQSSPVSPSALSSTSDAAAALSARGNGAPKGKLVYNWNLVGTPGDYDGGCGNGHRVFVQRDAKTSTSSSRTTTTAGTSSSAMRRSAIRR